MMNEKEKDERCSYNTIPFSDSERSDSELTPAADKAISGKGAKRKTSTSWNAPKNYKVYSTKRKTEKSMEKKNVKKKIQRKEKEVDSEVEVHIYPSRKKRTANFMSLAIPEDDDLFFCEDCNFEYISECPLHALIPVQDPNVPPECKKGLDSNYCWKTLPQGLAIKKSKIKGAGLGVFATKFSQ